jgi:hypothetical protein
MFSHWIFYKQNQLSLSICGAMLGGSVLSFIEEKPARLTLATSWHAKMTLTLND